MKSAASICFTSQHIVLIAAAGSFLLQTSSAQQALTPLSQPELAQIGSAVTAGHAFTSITMEGTVLRNVSPSPITAPIRIIIQADGTTEIRQGSGSEEMVESYAAPGTTGTCSYSGPSSETTSMEEARCLSSASLILPTVALSQPQVASILSVTRKTVDVSGTTAIKLDLAMARYTQQVNTAPLMSNTAGLTGSAAKAAWSGRTLLLDPATLLPIAMQYKSFSGKKGSSAIPLEMLYSDYRNSSGLTVPYHIKRQIGGNTIQDIQITSVILH